VVVGERRTRGGPTPSTSTTRDELAPAADDPAGPSSEQRRAFQRWSVGIYLAVVVILLGASLLRTRGDLVYVIDDPAIHLQTAETLAFDGTWGIEPGDYESVSSSPLWTTMLAGLTLLVPTGREWLPLLLNVAAGVGVLAVLAAQQSVLRPSARRPLDVAAVAVLVVVVLFLPGLVMVGMEHTLHMLLVLAAVIGIGRQAAGVPWRRPWLPYVLLAAATLVRFETLFVGAGLVVGLLVECGRRLGPSPPQAWRSRLRLAVTVAIAVGLPVATYAAVNLAQGQSVLPNSVLAKSVGGQASDDSAGIRGVAERLVEDPLVTAVVLIAVAYLAAAWLDGRRRNAFGATVVVVAGMLHVWLARIGWYERYQAYLLALGALVTLAIAAEVVPRPRRALVPFLVVLALLVGSNKWFMLQSVATTSDGTHDHHVLAGRFLAEYYDDELIATGDLGYISLIRDGPVVDLNGLGDHEVLTARLDGEDTQAFWAGLARRRGFEVVAVFPQTLQLDTPGEWILVGEWLLSHKTSAPDRRFQFWATTPDAAEELRDDLETFIPNMTRGVSLHINEVVDFRIADLRARQEGD
jgi:hypothetical protein